MARVKRDVTGCLMDASGAFVTLDHDRVWDDADPLVAAYPDVFDLEPKRPKPKPQT